MKRILAAFMFFTRLPLWKIANVDKKYFERVVPLWPLVGWLTGGLMALVYTCAMLCGASVEIAVVLALISRVLLTGGLHEDGFADFCDGFGGGTTKEKTLLIMKDSHIGTYGVLGLILYYLLLFFSLTSLLTFSKDSCFGSYYMSPLVLIVGDAICKFISSTIIYRLPYVRKEDESKNKLIYTKTPIGEKLLSLVLGMLPLGVFIFVFHALDIQISVCIAIIASAIAAILLFTTMKRRIGGYTGDCCGATFIITETVFYLTMSMACKLLSQY